MNNIGKTAVLSLALVCALLVVAVPGIDAEDATYQDITAEDFMSLAQDGTITLDADYSLTTPLKVSGELVIDLNGHTIVNASSNADHTVAALEGSDLTVADGSADGTGEIDCITDGKAAVAVYPGATVKLLGGTYDRNTETGESIEVGGDNTWYTIKNHGDLTIDGADIRNSGSYSSCIANGWYDGSATETPNGNDLVVYGGTPATLTILSGTIDGGINAVKNDDAGELYIYGGTFTNSTQATVMNWNVTEISGGYFQSTGYDVITGYADDVIDRGYLRITGGTFVTDDAFCVYNQTIGKGDIAITGGIFSPAIAAGFVPEGYSVYDYAGLKVIAPASAEGSAIVIGGIPFATIGDALALINVAGEFAQIVDGALTFVDDLTDTADVTLTVPEGSDVTIDLNGHDVVLGVITVNGGLAVNDTVGEGSLSTTNVIVEGGDLSGDGTIVGSSGDDLIDIFDSGSVTGITIDITAVTGGAVTVNVGVTGAVEVSGITVLIQNTESVVDRGIFVNPTLEGGSVEVSDVTFDFNGNDSCPFNADVDGTTVLSVSDFTYIDAARSNKALFNAVGDVTIGSEGGLDIARVSDVVLWDASGEGNSFTVEGDLVADGRITVTTGGGLVIPDGSTMVVNRTITVTSDASISGKLLFGSDRTNAISLDGVVAGDSGLTMSLGSVVLSGQVSEGTLTLDGSGAVEDELDLGQAVLAVPAGSQLYVAADAVINGETGLSVMGEVSVFGTVSAPVVNGGSVKVYGDGQVTGDVSGNEVETPEDPIEVSISHISDVTITLGNELRVAVTVFPGDARITASAGEVVLDVDGRVISWTPDEAGTYTVTVTAEYDGQVDTTTFKVTVNEPATDDPDDGWDIDWRYVLIAIVLIVMIVILVARFL